MMIDFDYLFNKFNIQSKGILHLGSSTGQEALKYKSLGIERVIWVEAIPKVFGELVKYLEIVGCMNEGCICINACVSDVDGKEVVFNISNNEAQSSSFLELGYHKIIHPSVEYIDHIKMVTKRVSTIVKEMNIDLTGIDFLNADLQGVELLALKGMGDLLYNLKYCYLEVNKRSTYVGCALIEEVDEYLSLFGFKRVETGTWVADTWTDALYIKD
jgi:FkbM family methyltransferase